MTATAAKASTIKLQTNIPLIGVVQYCDYAKSKTEGYSDQIKLKGTFDGHGEASVYLPLPVASELVKVGMMDVSGVDRFGNPAWKWTYREKIQILKQEDGPRKYTTVTQVEKNGSPPVQQGDAHEDEPADEGQEAKAIRRRWADMQECYECCVKIAVKAWRQENAEVGGDFLVAASATLFIEANKRNLPPPPKREAE